MFFRSERLFLRPAWPEDRPGLAHIAAADRMARYLAGPDQPVDGFCPQLLITAPGLDGRTIGVIALTPHDPVPELECWIGPSWRGRGFAAEAGRGMMALARTIGHRRIAAAPLAADPAPRALLRRLGFRPTGVVEQRFSGPHGVIAPVLPHVADLDGQCEGGDDDGGRSGDDGVAMPRRAA